MTHTQKLQSVSDDELLRRLSKLAQQSRRLESELVAHIGEVDQRRLYASRACPSMFTYCTEVLHLSEAKAYLRIAAARAARKHPLILEMLADGRLHLSGVAKLAPHLTDGNCESVLARATHNSKREIEELVAELSPKPDVPPGGGSCRRHRSGFRSRCGPPNSVRTQLALRDAGKFELPVFGSNFGSGGAQASNPCLQSSI